jgi:glyoxylase-like metal-dependent hydrolase (beta-lactamase superfamily II)
MQHSHEVFENKAFRRTHSSIHAIPIEGDGSGHTRSRRHFLAMIVGTGFAGMSLLEKSIVRAALARSQAAGAPTNLFEIEKVAEGVYAALARPTAMINSNAAIFVNSNDVVVMDSHSKPSAAAALIAQIGKEITPKPVRYVVNSHFHWDHMQGNSAYRSLFPGVEFVASEATRRLMAQEGEKRLKSSLTELAGSIDQNKQKLGKAKSAGEKAFYQKLLTEQEAYAKEMAKFKLELPTVTVGQTPVVHDKAHTLHFAFAGRAHTEGDVVIFCPEKKVIATGDMVHGFFPYIGDGYPREWPKTIDVVGKYAFDSLIGGHGPVHRDRIRFKHMRDYIEELTARVAEGKKAGKGIAELQKTISLSSLRSLQTDNYASMIQDALTKFTPVLGKASLESDLQSNIKDVFNTIDKA